MNDLSGANVVETLRNVASRLPDRNALIIQQARHTQRISYGQLWDRIDRVSQGFLDGGLKPGDRAVLMIPMSIDLYVVLLAILKMGGVVIFVDPWIKPRQISAFAAFAEPVAFVGIPKSHLLRWFEPGLRRLKMTVTNGRRFGSIPARWSLRELEHSKPNGLIHPADPADTALITFTSGSSGNPKGANRTHGFLLAQHHALEAEFPYRDTDVDMPMFPVFALNNLAAGLTSVVPAMDFRRVDRIDAHAILQQMIDEGVTVSTASPPFFDQTADYVLAHPSRKPKLRRILSGGAPIRDDQLLKWKAAFPDTEILVVYGSTEAEPVAHIDAEERLEFAGRDGFCVGTPVAAIDTKVIRIQQRPVRLSDDGWTEHELKQGEIGELVVAGDHVCRDYFRSAFAVRENKITEPSDRVWHRMGDTGYFDADGRFWVVGRVHSTIYRDGATLHPQIVEQIAKGSDRRIERVAAIGLVRDGKQQAAIVLQPTAEADRDQLIAAVRKRLQEREINIDHVVCFDVPLPVDPRHNAKIDYNQLRQMLLTTV